MMLRRRIEETKLIHELPSEYQQIDYIESSGTQYIDISSTEDTYEFEITTMVNQSRADIALFTGSETNANKRFNGACQLVNYLSVRRRDGLDNLLKDAYIDLSDGLNKKLTYISTAEFGEIIDANTNTSLVKNTETVQLYQMPIYLFHSGGTQYNTHYVSCKFYYAKYWKNKKLKYYLIPCYRKADNEPGVYDLVNQSFYTNNGTGDFIIPT